MPATSTTIKLLKELKILDIFTYIFLKEVHKSLMVVNIVDNINVLQDFAYALHQLVFEGDNHDADNQLG